MPQRPEYIRCIRQTHVDHTHESWCGRALWRHDKPFVDIDHAIYNAQQEGRLVACPECINAICHILKEAQDTLGG